MGRTVPLILLILLSACTRYEPNVAASFDVQQRIQTLPDGPMKAEIQYGKDLFFDTPKWIGPQGSVKAYTGNRMTCKNCHLDGGTRDMGISLLDTHGLYPQYRSREGKILNLSERINSCVENPMLGKPIPEHTREMQALLLYLRFLNQGRPVLAQDQDHRMAKIDWPNTAASPERGAKLYQQHCARCHGANGLGQLQPDQKMYVYPPLWGSESYRIGSSMHRVGVFARFIKSNMPYGEATPNKPALTDQEALDIAGFVNSDHLNPRPGLRPGPPLFPSPEFKPFDSPQPPYADPFPPDQHKYGPFPPIVQFYREKRKYNPPTDGDLNGP